MNERNEQLQRLQGMQSDETGFKRVIGLFGGMNIIVGIMIGSGIFYLGSFVLTRTGMSQGLSLLIWLLGGLITLLCGLCYAELGAMMPKAGGSFVYLNEAYGPRVAFMSGFSGFIIGNAGSIAALAVALVKVISQLYPMGRWTAKFIAIGFILILSVINYFGVKFGTAVQNFFNIVKFVPIGAILIGGLVKGTQKVDLSLVPTATTSTSDMFSMIALGIVASLWAYEGWTNLNAVSEEIKNPKRNLPLAIILSITGVTIIYILFNYSIYRVIPMERISEMIANGDNYLGTESAKILFGSKGELIVAAGMLLAIFGSLNGCVMVFPRFTYSMSKEGTFFEVFGHLHEEYKTPSAAIVAQAIISSILVLLLDLGNLTDLVVFSGMIFNALILYSVIIFRKRFPELNRPYKVWFYPVSVILAIIVMIGLMINSLIDDPILPLLNLIVPIIGLVLYEIIQRKKKSKTMSNIAE